MLAVSEDSYLSPMLDQRFTDNWVDICGTSPTDADHVDSRRVAQDREKLPAAAERVNEVANQGVAHHTRIDPRTLTVTEVDSAFRAIEDVLERYYALLHGASLGGVAALDLACAPCRHGIFRWH